MIEIDLKHLISFSNSLNFAHQCSIFKFMYKLCQNYDFVHLNKVIIINKFENATDYLKKHTMQTFTLNRSQTLTVKKALQITVLTIINNI